MGLMLTKSAKESKKQNGDLDIALVMQQSDRETNISVGKTTMDSIDFCVIQNESFD